MTSDKKPVKALSSIRFNKPKDGRTRCWTIIFYPDSAPENWREIIESWGCETYISPLHDRDINADGEVKKAHYHVVLKFGSNSKKSLAQIQTLSDMLSGTKVIWEKCVVPDLAGAVKYLIHANNPEKAQYCIEDIIALNGADVLSCFEEARDIDGHVGAMMEWIDKSKTASFAELARYARDNNPQWFRTLTAKRTVFLKHYCTTVGWEREQREREKRLREADKPKCVICRKPVEQWLLHRQQAHNGEYVVVCDDCESTFSKMRDDNIRFIFEEDEQ